MKNSLFFMKFCLISNTFREGYFALLSIYLLLVLGGVRLDFSTIHTNIWDAVIAIPVIMILTQLLKKLLHIPSKFVPTIAVILGLFISIFISHKGDLTSGIFMGFFYGYAAIGSYASLKTTVLSFRLKR